MRLNLTIHDTLTQRPTLSTVVLNPEQLELSIQLFADQVYRSLFYSTFTNDENKPYLTNENPLLTRYLNQLVLHFKGAWENHSNTGYCSVKIEQMPGGVTFKSQLLDDCFHNTDMAKSIQKALANAHSSPYAGYHEVFDKNLTLRFVTLN